MTANGRVLRTGTVLGALVLIASIACVVGLGWLLDAVGLPSAKTWVYVVAIAVAPLLIAVAVTVGQAEPGRDGLVKQFSSNLFGVAITCLMLTSFGLAIWAIRRNRILGRIAAWRGTTSGSPCRCSSRTARTTARYPLPRHTAPTSRAVNSPGAATPDLHRGRGWRRAHRPRPLPQVSAFIADWIADTFAGVS